MSKWLEDNPISTECGRELLLSDVDEKIDVAVKVARERAEVSTLF